MLLRFFRIYKTLGFLYNHGFGYRLDYLAYSGKGLDDS